VWAFAWLAAVLGHLGRGLEAADALDAIRRLKPDFGATFIGRSFNFTDPQHTQWLRDGLVKAGMPPEGWGND
jgi:hypothetical protein